MIVGIVTTKSPSVTGLPFGYSIVNETVASPLGAIVTEPSLIVASVLEAPLAVAEAVPCVTVMPTALHAPVKFWSVAFAWTGAQDNGDGIVIAVSLEKKNEIETVLKTRGIFDYLYGFWLWKYQKKSCGCYPEL